MSDINELDNNTLPEIAATEEAFDQFQAHSTVEESDYILLSDIVPAENTVETPEIPSSYDDGLIGNTEVSSVEYLYEPQVEAANGYDIAETVQLSDLSERLSFANSDHDYDARPEEIRDAGFDDVLPAIRNSPPTEQVKQTLPRKRGRKPKKPLDTSLPVEKKTGLSEDPINLNQTVPKTTTRGRRGRKPKNSQPVSSIEVDNNVNGTAGSLDVTEPPTKMTRRQWRKANPLSETDEDKKMVALDEKLTEPLMTTPVPKKRGRKSKKRKQDSKIKSKTLELDEESKITAMEAEDDGDDISLSKLKKSIVSADSTDATISKVVETQDTKVTSNSLLDDFDNNIDKVIAATPNVLVESVADSHSNFKLNIDSVSSLGINDKPVETKTPSEVEPVPEAQSSLLVEDNSKRPQRRNARKTMHYEVDSDADPFADLSSSDDETYGLKRRKKNDDYEFVPGEGKDSSDESIHDSSGDEDFGKVSTPKKKQTQRGRKRGRSIKETPVKPLPPPSTKNDSDDIEECLTPAVIKGDENNAKQTLVKPELIKQNTMELANKEFENFLNRRMQGSEGLKISKLSKKKNSATAVTPLEIPTIESTRTKINISTQTTKKETNSASIQTSSPYSIKMINTIDLTPQQTDNACEFLQSILKTTSELGTLMTDKSEEFIQKKVNPSYVKDTMKVDYCIKKAFLLFKLAKDNLTTMEENLEKQYLEFLKVNDLSESIETEKKVTPKPPETNSDSDCEIVGETIAANPKTTAKPKFNPKTVFLNKELSIKIAKKSSENVDAKANKAMNIKGRHAVWINDSVMVKKVKGQKSFLAQDSRNKKPPDHTPKKVTEEMVKSFFDEYYRAQALSICRLYTTPNWIECGTAVTCNYFFINKEDESCSSGGVSQPLAMNGNPEIDNIQKFDYDDRSSFKDKIESKDPQTLFSLCTEVLRNIMFPRNSLPSPKVSKPGHNMYRYNEGKPSTLFDLCIKSVCSYSEQKFHCNVVVTIPPNPETFGVNTAESLKTLCYKKVIELLCANKSDRATFPNEDEESSETNSQLDWTFLLDSVMSGSVETKSETSSLCSSTTKQFKKDLLESMTKHKNGVCRQSKVTSIKTPDALKKIAYNNMKLLLFGDIIDQEAELYELDEVYHVQQLSKLCFEVVSKYFNKDHNDSDRSIPVNALTIGTVNTLTDEAFWNMEETSNDSQFAEDDAFGNDYQDHTETRDDNIEPENWESQVQMQELKPAIINNRLEHHQGYESLEGPAQVHIKQEVLEDQTEYLEPINIKREPDFHTGMVNIPSDMANIITKRELHDYPDNEVPEPLSIDRDAAPDVPADEFENFVRTNKIMRAISYEDAQEEGSSIFSQSGARVRRQFVPDSYNNYEIDMDLLVPQQAEPLTAIVAKDTLMESSSDDNSGKQKTDKKQDKRKRGRPKRNSNISVPVKNHLEITAPVEKGNIKEVPAPVEKGKRKKEKAVPAAKPADKAIPTVNSDIAVMTRRMMERIRNEQKNGDSSNSDNEELATLSSKRNMKKKSSKNNKLIEEEIQCNNVDSTEQINEKTPDDPENSTFTGFSSTDQSDINQYQKYLNDVYDKIIPEKQKEKESNEIQSAPSPNYETERTSPVMMGDQPVELLECEPTMPMFERPKPKSKKTKKIDKPERTKFIERHGWKCYPTDGKDAKLYHCIPYVGLDKLPEIFVQTYFEYLNITEKSKEDAEVDRLTNLQSLHKQKQLSTELKSKGRTKEKTDSQQLGQTTDLESTLESPDHSNYNELAPSDDECPRVEDELPPPAPKQSTDNSLAKNLLMNENDSETEATKPAPETKQIKKEPGVSSQLNTRLRGKAADVKVFAHPQSLVLTADKMMKKELAILHAPIVPEDETKEYEPKESKYTPPKESSGKQKDRTRRSTRRERVNPDDSSSEEEKQWVSTKEKLLKRMEKKVQEDTSFADAKRAKIVTEFIEKRADKSLPAKPARGRGRRSKKKFLERQKQLRVLKNELYGEAAAHVGKKSTAQAYAKGRRNIRAVIDKKLLARSTVIANMEEFERKRRLSMKQNRLRELLGYEEGVNVLVINDEVCLEYDFEELQPVVTVHAFFTKVMKAHQYEGVKFMWDACFESLEMVESGNGGGGCILAHCMGLGKTLQVLALLHTVLTHPRVRMQRVLVCCPLSTVLNWVDEIHKWLGPVTDQIKVFELSKLKKTYERAYQLEDWYNGGGIFIIGYELFRSLSTLDPTLDDIRPTIIKKIRSALLDPGPDIIVCDEGHLLKNDSSVLAISMSRVKTKRRIILTGTPMQNNLREYYCMVDFVKPNLLGTYFEYSNRFENPIMNGQHRDSREEDIKLMKTRTHILHKVLEGCLQRQEASVLYPYLPKKHEYTVFISLTNCQSDLYKHYLSGCRTHPNSTNKSSLLKDYNILQKIWSHPRVLHNFQTRQRDAAAFKADRIEDDLAQDDLTASVDVKPAVGDVKPEAADVWWLDHTDGGNALESLESSNKFVTVFKILKECVELGDKLLIFSTSLFTMDALEYFLKAINGWSIGQEYYRLDGSVPPEVRQKWCREFNAEHNVKTKLFLISTRAGSLGLNMTSANRVIILDTSWNPAHDIQSIFRVYRFGQKKDCYIYRLVAMGTMEQKIYERSVTKQAVACRVVDEQQIDRHYNMGELAELYRLDVAGEGVSSGVAVGVRDVVLLRVARDTRALHAVHEHDSLLRDTREDLPEHERAAAWQQFQQEQQMHDRLTVMPKMMTTPKNTTKRPHASDASTPVIIQSASSALWNTPIVKSEDQNDPEYAPEPKKGRKNTIKCDIPVRKTSAITVPPIRPSSPITILPDSSDPQSQDIIAKITTALQKHNYKFADKSLHPTALAKMVSSIISNVNVEVTPANKEIASSLVNAMSVKAPGPEETPTADEKKSRKGRPKKKSRGRPKKSAEEKAADPVEEVVSPRTKRQAAITAELKIETGKESPSVVNLDEDDDSDAEYFPDDDYRHSDAEPIQPVVPIKVVEQPIPPAKKPQPTTSKADDTSILLSDDEAPLKTTASTSTSDEVIPLHTSLLSNKNFIKIVAHTYLKGNPMMDEDAATLAAEYSTSKALKEVQSTGKSIESGPIYDIAKKILGIEVLRKLHYADAKKTAQSKSSESTPQKTAPTPPPEPARPTKIRPKPLSKMTAPEVKTAKVTPKPLSKMIKTEESSPAKKVSITIKHSSILKPLEVVSALKHEPVEAGTSKLPPRPQPGPSASLAAAGNPVIITRDYVGQQTAHSMAGVVPVGLIKRVDAEPHTAAFAQGEESILPDDDEVHFVSNVDPAPAPAPAAAAPPPPAPPSLIPAKVLDILARKRSQSARGAKLVPPEKPAAASPVPAIQPMLTLDSGKVYSLQPVQNLPPNTRVIRLPKNVKISPGPPPPPLPPPPPAQLTSTICLDSDEEDAPTIVSGPIPAHAALNYPTPVSLHAAGSNLGPQVLSQSGVIYPLTLQSGPAPHQIIQQTIGQHQIIQLQRGQQLLGEQPQLPQVNLQGQQVVNELGEKFIIQSNDKGFVLVPAEAALQGGDVNAIGAQPASVANPVAGVRARRRANNPQATVPSVGACVSVETAKLDMPEQSAGRVGPRRMVKKPPATVPSLGANVSVVTTDLDMPGQIAQPSSAENTSTKAPTPKLQQKEPKTKPQPPAGKPAATKPAVIANSSEKPTDREEMVTVPKEATPPPIKCYGNKKLASSSKVVASSSSSSSSERSRSPSPDPLSLFKNVVHIQAPCGETSKPARTKSAKTAAPPPVAKTRPGPLSKTFGSAAKNTKPKSNTKTDTPSSKPGSAKIIHSSKPPRLLASFDLTDSPPTATKKTVVAPSGKPPKILNATLNNPSTIIGTSKNIIIGGANKSLSKAGSAKKTNETAASSPQSPAARVVHITNMKTLTPPTPKAKPQPEAKRKADTSTAASDPKKSKKPMRLEDFSLDDIEDIIELE